MNIGFPVQYSEHFLYENDEKAVRLAAKEIIKNQSWSIKHESADRINASPASRLVGWAREIQLDFSLEGSLKVTGQGFSSRKNRTRVKNFLIEMSKRSDR